MPDTQRRAFAEEMGGDHAPTDAELSRDMFHYSGGVFARFRGGVDEEAAVARLAGELGDTVSVIPPSEPTDQQNLRNVRPLPFLFAGFSLALAVGALTHMSASVLRRRRGELAVLRSLGMTPLQVRACLGWQATTLAVVGLVVGVPLGIALGRLAWQAVADAPPMIYVAPLAVLALALAVPVALTVANLVAAIPGQRAARQGPEGLLFPSASGRIMRRSNFQPVWIRAADTAGWPMTAPLRRTVGYGQTNKGWRWTGTAQWSPHDLRHVAACWMLFDLGLDPAIVADKLGHADPNFTIRRYIGVRGNPDTAAMAVTDGW